MQERTNLIQQEFKNEYIKACINILHTSSFMLKMKNKVLRPFNLSLQQFNILNILNNQYPAPSTIKLLAEQMLDETSNVSRLVEKLRKKELISRAISATDRRKVEISMTEEGLNIFLKAANALEHITAFQLGNLSESEVTLLNELLDKTRSE